MSEKGDESVENVPEDGEVIDQEKILENEEVSVNETSEQPHQTENLNEITLEEQTMEDEKGDAAQEGGGALEDEGDVLEGGGGDATEEGGDVPEEGGDVPGEGGDVPEEGGDVLEEGGDVPEEGGGVSEEGGGVSEEGGGVSEEETTEMRPDEIVTDEEIPHYTDDDKEELGDDQFHLADESASRLVLELDEMPGEEDVTAEELELSAPLDQWVSDLVPCMRELIAPELYPLVEQPEEQVDEQIDEVPCKLPEVLVSDSPMMARFQKTLRAHLLRQKEKLENDIFDMELDCNKKNREIKNFGLLINKEQEHLNKQRDLTAKYKDSVVEVTKKRKQYDNANTKKAAELKETETAFKETTHLDKSLFQQYQEMNELAYRLSEMEKSQNEELKLAKNLSEKQRADRIKLAHEKQNQDLFIWKQMQELERLGLETQAFIEQTELKKIEISQLTQCITEIEADTDALRKENAMIICAIKYLVQEIKRRDKAFKEASDKVEKAQSELSLVVMRIRSYNKSLKSEEDRRNFLASSKSKFELLIQRNQHLHQALIVKQDEVMDKLAHVQSMIDALESEQIAKGDEDNDLRARHKVITTEIDDLTRKRLELKRRYMTVMSEMKIQSAMKKRLRKNMEELSRDNQDIGLRKLEVECKIGELMTDIEHAKVKKVQLEVKIDGLKNRIKDKQSELKTLDVHKKKINHQILSYKSKVIGSKKRLESLVKFNDDSVGQNQMARRAESLQQELVQVEENIDQIKQMWIDTQNALIENTYSLTQLESTTNTIRKHLFLTKYKREKLENKLNEVDAEKKKADKEFTRFYIKLTTMTQENFRHEQAKEKLANMAKETEAKFISVLKDAEEVGVNLQNEICFLDDGNKEMSEEVSRLQREFLAWEKKWKVAVEARERVEKERKATGEIGAMKLEIHRMSVRYAQLKKAQEKLIVDLELCISRRDNIMDVALAKEKRMSSAKATYTREQFNKKVETIRQKIKQLQTGLKNAEKEIEDLESRREELMADYMIKQKQLSEVKLGVDKLETEIQEGQLHKYKSLELVVRQQRKIRLLDEVKHGRYRFYCKNENNLPNEEERQESIHNSLLDVIQSLLADFPKLKLQLLQIYNTLTSTID